MRPGVTIRTAQKALGIVWFRRDLRVADNEALSAAVASSGSLVPLFIDDDVSPSRRLGGASRWWRGRSLQALDTSLRAMGSRLTVRRGPAQDVFDSILTE